MKHTGMETVIVPVSGGDGLLVLKEMGDAARIEEIHSALHALNSSSETLCAPLTMFVTYSQRPRFGEKDKCLVALLLYGVNKGVVKRP